MAGTSVEELRMLVAVEAHGSLTAAAQALGVTQQAVSQRMRALERRWGLALFSRSARGTTLTDQGVMVAGWAGPVLGQVDGFERAVAALRTDSAAHVRIGASLTVAEHLLPGWLVAYAAESDAAQVELTAVNSATVVERVRSGADDLGFVETPDPPARLATLVVAHDEVVIVVAPGHPWSRRTSLSPAEVARTPLLSREPGSGTRLTLERALEAALGPGTVVAPAAELSTTASIRATVLAGGGVAALSERAVRDDVAAGRLVRVRVDGPSLSRPLAAVWDPRRRLSPAAARVLDIAAGPAR
ncbi:LysR family transcriptional regulator [Demequina sp. SYSU T00192]|uniref:LysR family transcriptional regulator n=1 Tax=Demequina litoralis TaxID=3051660 RepID=A0ABT8G665_9MICO|nr:LysR family transcriptional regulator [Demequina sp. SYSU T00192]MDN4474617.1 LysR family transcriptional regulator [Demequina sp. SYSU T00192]